MVSKALSPPECVNASRRVQSSTNVPLARAFVKDPLSDACIRLTKCSDKAAAAPTSIFYNESCPPPAGTAYGGRLALAPHDRGHSQNSGQWS